MKLLGEREREVFDPEVHLSLFSAAEIWNEPARSKSAGHLVTMKPTTTLL